MGVSVVVVENQLVLLEGNSSSDLNDGEIAMMILLISC